MALPGDFDFAVRSTKGEEKVCVLDRNPWLAKMVSVISSRFSNIGILFKDEEI